MSEIRVCPVGLGVVVGGWLLFFQHSRFAVLTSISPAESTGPASTETLGGRCLFLFSFHITSFVLLIVSVLERHETPPPVAVARSLDPLEEKKAIPAFLCRICPRQGDSRKDGLKGNLLMISFFLKKKSETKQSRTFLETKSRSRIKCISELSDLTEAKAVFWPPFGAT